MHISFEKFHGTGNDFIIIDNRRNLLNNQDYRLFRELCSIHTGIGADGLILIESSDQFDFNMLYYNADGNPGSMCGNGGRCAVAFANKLRIIADKMNVTFDAFDGKHVAQVINFKNTGSSYVSLKMGNVDAVESLNNDFVLNTGSPHFVTFVKDLKATDVYNEGRAIRNSDIFLAEGINVNFVEQHKDELNVRTYERGVENETLSCGTGVVASAIAASIRNKATGNCEYKISTPGGNLVVKFSSNGKTYHDIFLEGPAEFVFTGIMEI